MADANQNQAPATGQAAPATGAGAQQGEDYGDKALDAGYSKFSGGKKLDRGTGEKITDAARGMFEKATGKHVPDKVSN